MTHVCVARDEMGNETYILKKANMNIGVWRPLRGMMPPPGGIIPQGKGGVIPRWYIFCAAVPAAYIVRQIRDIVTLMDRKQV